MLARMTHLETVSEIYAAFGRGDVPAILERVSDDVRWEHWADWFPHRDGIDHLAPRSGRDGVAEFFGVIGAWEISEFEVQDLGASDSQVFAQIQIAARLPNGGSLRDEELHVWHFDSEGKVDHFRHYVDTAKHMAAARGEATLG
jgi:uncharacterized protein